MMGAIKKLVASLRKGEIMADIIKVQQIADDAPYTVGDIWGGTEADVAPFLERGTAEILEGSMPQPKQQDEQPQPPQEGEAAKPQE